MDHKKNPCNCMNDCPCYPRCDEMMEQNQMPGWQPSPPNQMPGGGIPQDWWRGMPQPTMPQPTMPQPTMPQPTMPMPQTFMPWMQKDVEMENEQDWENLKAQYPDMAKMIQNKVEEVCDRMEYEGSAMFDMTPDKYRVRDMAGEIQKMVENQILTEPEEEQPDLYTMNRETCRNCRPNQNFLGDFIEVMLYQEMHRRRCRHRRCRRW